MSDIKIYERPAERIRAIRFESWEQLAAEGVTFPASPYLDPRDLQAMEPGQFLILGKHNVICGWASGIGYEEVGEEP